MALIEMHYVTDTDEVTVTFNGALTTAWVTHRLTGLSARRHALQNPEDRYDQTIGSDLAIARAKATLYNKIQRQLSKHAIPSVEGLI